MKKVLIIFLLISAWLPTHLHAQVGIVLGGKGGFNTSNLSKNIDGNFKATSSWAGGAFISVILAKAFAIQPEFIIRQGGATQVTNNSNTQVDLTYFQIPLLLKIRIPIAGVAFPHIFAGPTYDYVTNSSFTKTSTQNGGSADIHAGPFQKTGAGALVGAGIDLEIQRLFLTADARYGFGFNNISTDFLAVKGSYYTLMAGIGFKFGSK